MQETARKRLLAFKEMVHPTFRSTLSSGLLEWYRNRESSHKRRLEEREVFNFFEKKKKYIDVILFSILPGTGFWPVDS